MTKDEKLDNRLKNIINVLNEISFSIINLQAINAKAISEQKVTDAINSFALFVSVIITVLFSFLIYLTAEIPYLPIVLIIFLLLFLLWILNGLKGDMNRESKMDKKFRDDITKAMDDVTKEINQRKAELEENDGEKKQ